MCVVPDTDSQMGQIIHRGCQLLYESDVNNNTNVKHELVLVDGKVTGSGRGHESCSTNMRRDSLPRPLPLA